MIVNPLRFFSFRGGRVLRAPSPQPPPCAKGASPSGLPQAFYPSDPSKVRRVSQFAHEGKEKVSEPENYRLQKVGPYVRLRQPLERCRRFRATSRVLLKSRSNLSNHPAPPNGTPCSCFINH